MRRTSPLLLLSFLAFAACDCDDGDDVVVADGDVTEVDAGPVCMGMGGACVDGADCCEGPCEGNVCTEGSCLADAQACSAGTDCCSGSCEGGLCTTPTACGAIGDACTAGGDCCAGNCDAGVCAVPAGCGMTGTVCTAASECCSLNCADAAGAPCAGGSCNCAPLAGCAAASEACTSDAQCCNGLCSDGMCASPGSCLPAGEPCGTEGLNGSCCSTVCLDRGDGPRCQFLGGCRVQDELCSSDSECCSGACQEAGTTSDGRPILRCANAESCLPVGEVCGGGGSSSNCCPNGGGDTGCEPTGGGFRRCLGGDGSCTLPTFECETTDECCKDAYPSIECQPPTDERAGGGDICCLGDGDECAFGDVCCGGICAPDPADGVLRCGASCIPDAQACTTDSDCCGCGCVAGACTSDADSCDPCTGPQLGESCVRDGEACCNDPAVVCNPLGEFATCVLAD